MKHRSANVGSGIVAVLLVLGLVPALRAQTTPNVISTGKKVTLTSYLVPEAPTVFVFIKRSSSLERAFLTDIQNEIKPAMGFCVVQLQTGLEPAALQYEIKDTPTAIVYDRRGRVVMRSADASQIRLAIRKAAGTMRIDWAEEGDPLYAEAQRVIGRPLMPGILRTMSLKPQYLAYINDLANLEHFKDGYLKRRIKEMIATYVSALNKCKY